MFKCKSEWKNEIEVLQAWCNKESMWVTELSEHCCNSHEVFIRCLIFFESKVVKFVFEELIEILMRRGWMTILIKENVALEVLFGEISQGGVFCTVMVSLNVKKSKAITNCVIQTGKVLKQFFISSTV